jgi:casein kinase II subunit alpha
MSKMSTRRPSKFNYLYQYLQEISGDEIHWIIKILKPTNELNVLREIKILNELKNGPNIVKLEAALKDDEDDTPWLVFENK